MSESSAKHQFTRIRRDPIRRTIVVERTEMLSRSMKRIHFIGEDLRGFESAAPDDHIKLILPQAGSREPAKRDYTPRAFDAVRGALMIDFALHDAGPATAWARDAQAGETLTIGGPRGSTVVPDDFDWYLLVGDETAIPAIARRMEELRREVLVRAVILSNGPADRVQLDGRSDAQIDWVDRDRTGRNDSDSLIATIDSNLPAGEGFIWIGAEARVARALRNHFVDALGHPKQWVKASGYWTRGFGGSEQAKIED